MDVTGSTSVTGAPTGVTSALQALVTRVEAGSTLVAVRPLGRDAASGMTHKQGGYGRPLRLELRREDGSLAHLVLHTGKPDEFGHDRRSDRAQQTVLAFDTFGLLPRHAVPLDVGFIDADGVTSSVGTTGEPYLLTSYAPGQPYADELRQVAVSGRCSARDLGRARRLATYLAELHRPNGLQEWPGLQVSREVAYRRAIRDLLGHGEGIFGISDAYDGTVPGASPGRLECIEAACLDWRWRLKGRSERLTRTHGDFHPFNVLVGEELDSLALLDASRGCLGDPADDVTCMAINYVFFALDRPAAWASGLGPLWQTFWSTYLELTGDGELLGVAPPFLTWRALVLACPRWYPDLSGGARDRFLGLAERALESGRFDPDWAHGLFS